MLRARWIVPLILVVPLAAPAPADQLIEGRAYSLVDDTRAPPMLPHELARYDDGISQARSRVIPTDEPPAPPVREWSYGPSHGSTPLAGHDGADVARPPPASDHPDAADRPVPPPSSLPPSRPSPPPADATPAPTEPDGPNDPPEHGTPDHPSEEGPDAPATCAGLCFALELGLL